MEHRPTDGDGWGVAIEPVGYPETAVLCSYRAHAEPEPGLVFLSSAEHRFYQHGKRSFSPPASAAKIRVTDDTVAIPDADDEGTAGQ